MPNLTFAANYRLGHESAGHHATNVLFHIGAALGLFGFLRRTFAIAAPALEGVTADLIALGMAAIWAVHPLNTGAVTYTVQRAESLMGMFYLLTLYCSARAQQSVAGRTRWRVAAVVLCGLGMATKEVMVTAPIVVWLWHVVFAGAPWNPFVDRERRKFYGALAATWLILAGLMMTGTEATTALSSAMSGSRSFGWTPWNYLLTQTEVVTHYLRLVPVPHPLVLDYYGWTPATSLQIVWPHALLLVTLASATIVGLAKRHSLGFAGGAFFLILAPTSSALPIPTEIAAEHRMYLPSIAVISVLVGCFISGLVKLVGNRRVLTAALLSILGLSILMLGQGTRARSRDYGSEPGMWLDTIKKRPDNARARVNYGIWLMSAGQYQAAEVQMRQAAQFWSDSETSAQIYVQLGAALCAQRRCTEGIPYLERALELHPDIDDANAVLAQAFSETGDFERSLSYFRRAVRQYPDNPALLARAAWLFATVPDPSLKDAELAALLASKAVTLTRRQDFGALESLAAAYAARGDFDAALKTASEALTVARAAGEQDAAALLARRTEEYRARIVR